MNLEQLADQNINDIQLVFSGTEYDDLKAIINMGFELEIRGGKIYANSKAPKYKIALARLIDTLLEEYGSVSSEWEEDYKVVISQRFYNMQQVYDDILSQLRATDTISSIMMRMITHWQPTKEERLKFLNQD